MKRVLLFVLCFLPLLGLQAQELSDTSSNYLVEEFSNQIEHNDPPTQDTVSTLTLLINMANNSLTSCNNQIEQWSLILTILSIFLTGVGVFGVSRIRRLERRYSRFEKSEESQRQKNEILAYYIRRLSDWLYRESFNSINSSAETAMNDRQYESMKDVYIGYQLIRLSVTIIPNENKRAEETKRAIKEIEQALNQIVGRGGKDDLKALQEMAEFEINKVKKKMLKKAAKELQDRLINHG